MNLNQFDIQMARLIGVYGDRAYGGERIKILFEMLRDWEPWWFEHQVTHFIINSRTAPLVADFREAMDQERARLAALTQLEKLQAEDLPPNPNACIYCGDSGVLMCIHEKKTGFWAFKCDCSFGKSDPRSFPVLKTGHLEQGFQYLTKDQFLLLRGKSESQKQSYAKEAG